MISRVSPYRVRASVAAVQPARVRDLEVPGALSLVLGGAATRFALFLFGSERLGRDAILAAAISIASAWLLVTMIPTIAIESAPRGRLDGRDPDA